MAKNKERDKLEIAAKATIGTGATGAAIAGVRAHHQRGIDVTKIDMKGGYKVPKNSDRPMHSVFNTQRDSWARHLKSVGADVRERGYFTFGVKNQLKSRVIKDFETGSHKKPAATMYVGRSAIPTETEGYIRAKSFFTGKPTYRVFTDFGSGNQDTPKIEIGGGKVLRSWMWAPKDKTFTRNIVPGGDILKATDAKRPNINVSSIPVKDTFTKDVFRNAPKNKKPVVTMTVGGGTWWVTAMDDYKRDLTTAKKSLDNTYGKNNYRLNVLAGPQASDDARKAFKSIADEHRGTVRYIPKTNEAGIKKLYRKSDVMIMAPGSTSAEYAALKGHKPKILALDLPNSPHFKTNTEWLKGNFGSVESMDTSKAWDEGVLTQKLKNLRDAKPVKSEAVSLGADDAKKVMNAVKTDFAHEVKKTKRIGGVAGGLLLAGAGLHMYNKNKKGTEKRAALEGSDNLILVGGGTTIAVPTLRGATSFGHITKYLNPKKSTNMSIDDKAQALSDYASFTQRYLNKNPIGKTLKSTANKQIKGEKLNMRERAADKLYFGVHRDRDTRNWAYHHYDKFSKDRYTDILKGWQDEVIEKASNNPKSNPKKIQRIKNEFAEFNADVEKIISNADVKPETAFKQIDAIKHRGVISRMHADKAKYIHGLYPRLITGQAALGVAGLGVAGIGARNMIRANKKS